MQCNCVLSANIFGILIRDALTIPLHIVVLRSCALLLRTVCTFLGQCNPSTNMGFHFPRILHVLRMQ